MGQTTAQALIQEGREAAKSSPDATAFSLNPYITQLIPLSVCITVPGD